MLRQFDCSLACVVNCQAPIAHRSRAIGLVVSCETCALSRSGKNSTRNLMAKSHQSLDGSYDAKKVDGHPQPGYELSPATTDLANA